MKKKYIQPEIEFEPLEDIMDGPVTASNPEGDTAANGYNVQDAKNGGDSEDAEGLNSLDIPFSLE